MWLIGRSRISSKTGIPVLPSSPESEILVNFRPSWLSAASLQSSL